MFEADFWQENRGKIREILARLDFPKGEGVLLETPADDELVESAKLAFLKGGRVWQWTALKGTPEVYHPLDLVAALSDYVPGEVREMALIYDLERRLVNVVRGRLGGIQRILREMPDAEFCVVDLKMGWAIFGTHHDELMFVKEPRRWDGRQI